MQKFKKVIALILSCAMLFSILAVSVSAADVSSTYTKYAPGKITEDMGTGTILSGGTAAANTTELSILGINVTSTDDAGALNASRDPLAPMNLLVFGSDANENPDPYLYNFYYNLADNNFVLPATEYDAASYKDWTGAYTLLNNAKSGPSAAATDEEEIQMVYGDANSLCNPLFYYEPDILFGANDNSFDVGLTYYQNNHNKLYNPLIISGWTTNNKAISDGTFKSTYTMANAVYEDALTISDYLEENMLGMVSRYNGGNIVQCGIDYSNFALGVYYYLQMRMNDDRLGVYQVEKAHYCTGIEVNDGIIRVTNDNTLSTRYLQYLDGLAELVPTGTEFPYSDTSSLKGNLDLIIMDTNDTSKVNSIQKLLISNVGVKFVNINAVMPQTAYGTTMQSADNILGVPWFVGLLYQGKFSIFSSSLSEYDYLAYFVEHIYHVKSDKVQDVVEEMISNEKELDSSRYSKLNSNYSAMIDEMIKAGAEYYYNNYFGSGIWKAVDDGRYAPWKEES